MPSIPTQIIGQSESFHALMDRIADYASLDSHVLIIGERGTGKDMIASRLHFLSPRWETQYFHVNCAAYTEPELDDTLFSPSEGLFMQASGSTLFLDNIDCLPLRLQEKLARAIEHGDHSADSDATEGLPPTRLITASHIDLRTLEPSGSFRADLLELLALHLITAPPLRTRTDDIAPLAAYFGRKISARLNAQHFPGFTPEATEQLETHKWSGNIRQLKTTVQRSVSEAFLHDETLTAPISTIIFDPFEGSAPLIDSQAASMPKPIVKPEPKTPQDKTFAKRTMTFERRIIDEALGVNDGHQGKAADYLGLTYHSFRGLLRKHGLKK